MTSKEAVRRNTKKVTPWVHSNLDQNVDEKKLNQKTRQALHLGGGSVTVLTSKNCRPKSQLHDTVLATDALKVNMHDKVSPNALEGTTPIPKHVPAHTTSDHHAQGQSSPSSSREESYNTGGSNSPDGRTSMSEERGDAPAYNPDHMGKKPLSQASRKQNLRSPKRERSPSDSAADDTLAAKRKRNRVYAQRSRQKKADEKDKLTARTKEQEAVIEIYKKALSIFYWRLYSSAPTWAFQKIKWFASQGSRHKTPNEVKCFLPKCDEKFYRELGNNAYGQLHQDEPESTTEEDFPPQETAADLSMEPRTKTPEKNVTSQSKPAPAAVVPPAASQCDPSTSYRVVTSHPVPNASVAHRPNQPMRSHQKLVSTSRDEVLTSVPGPSQATIKKETPPQQTAYPHVRRDFSQGSIEMVNESGLDPSIQRLIFEARQKQTSSSGGLVLYISAADQARYGPRGPDLVKRSLSLADREYQRLVYPQGQFVQQIYETQNYGDQVENVPSLIKVRNLQKTEIGNRYVDVATEQYAKPVVAGHYIVRHGDSHQQNFSHETPAPNIPSIVYDTWLQPPTDTEDYVTHEANSAADEEQPAEEENDRSEMIAAQSAHQDDVDDSHLSRVGKRRPAPLTLQPTLEQRIIPTTECPIASELCKTDSPLTFVPSTPTSPYVQAATNPTHILSSVTTGVRPTAIQVLSAPVLQANGKDETRAAVRTIPHTSLPTTLQCLQATRPQVVSFSGEGEEQRSQVVHQSGAAENSRQLYTLRPAQRGTLLEVDGAETAQVYIVHSSEAGNVLELAHASPQLKETMATSTERGRLPGTFVSFPYPSVQQAGLEVKLPDESSEYLNLLYSNGHCSNLPSLKSFDFEPMDVDSIDPSITPSSSS